MTGERPSVTSRIVEVFLTGNLTPLLILLSLIAGVVALLATPREEEPQIEVPLADVYIEVPGASAQEVERQVSTRLEKLLYQIDGVEYVYSLSRSNQAVVTVRFEVGQDREESLVKIYDKIESNLDAVPPQVASWVVKPVEIDDVPILAVTLYSNELDDYALRRAAEEMEIRIQGVDGVGRTWVLGGRPRRIRVLVDPDRLESHGVSTQQVAATLRAATAAMPAGTLERIGSEILLEASSTPAGAEDIGKLVVAVRQGRPIYLDDVAEVRDGPDESSDYCRIGFGEAGFDEVGTAFRDRSRDYPAVTIAVAKKRGTNAVEVSESVRQRVEDDAREVLPDAIHWRITRDHGETADTKVDELLEGLAVAVLIVVALLAVTLGWREALVVAMAVPITFALTLLVNWLAGYSINRVTLFALTLALGLVVDDPIVDVENIHRHLVRGCRDPLKAVIAAVNEVRPPIIQATLAVVISFVPLFFITGMMGPYMRPMALNVPLSMAMSLVVAFTVTPWMSYLALRGKAGRESGDEPAPDGESSPPAAIGRLYRFVMTPLFSSRVLRFAAILGTVILFAAAGYLALSRRVPLKMLPYDNKDELQVVIDMPEGTGLERTEAVAAEMAARLRGMPETTDVVSYAGLSSPVDFNGLVRHYYLRQGSNVADLRVNLVAKKVREHSSHEIALRVREDLSEIAARHGANIKVVESPPGPPVIATVTVEVYGAAHQDYDQIAASAISVADRMGREAGVVDVDTSVESSQAKLRYVLDREKAALHGIAPAEAAEGLAGLVDGVAVTTVRSRREVNPLVIEIRLPRERRSSLADLERLTITGASGRPVALGEVGSFEETTEEVTIYHKNLRRVAYVFGEMSGRAPAEAILDMQADLGTEGTGQMKEPGDRDYLDNGAGLAWSVPEGIELDWSGEGEWKITLDVFRDLGLAFAAACLGIYILLVHELKSYLMPLILMLSIPFTVIGILPGFWLLNQISGQPVAGYDNPTFFTATAMIGMIALSGIAVRNAILLVEFVHQAERQGKSLRSGLLEAGAVRIRPIFLTAGTAILAAVPIVLDPIFSGLAWALIFGLVVSTAFTLVLVPMAYFMVYGDR